MILCHDNFKYTILIDRLKNTELAKQRMTERRVATGALGGT